MARCPNINLPEWKELVASRGEDMAYYLWDQFDGDVPVQEYSSPTGANSITPKVKELIAKMGVDIMELSKYAKDNPNIDFSSANSIADVTAKIIAVSENATNEDLTEEMVHIATQILEEADPDLVTEMISQVGDLPIYQETFDEYKDNPVYQNPDGTPNIRKIKKEASDKLIARIVTKQLEEGVEEEVPSRLLSFFKRMWDKISDWFRGQYKSSGIDIFRKVGTEIVRGEVEGDFVDTAFLDQDVANIFFSVSGTQKSIQNKILNTRENVKKRIDKSEKISPVLNQDNEADNYYEVLVDGEFKRVKKRVTDRVKNWYRDKFPGKVFTPQEERDNEFKRQLGTEFHEMFEDIHARFFNSDGTKRINPGNAQTFTDPKKQAVYTKLEKYYTDLIGEFSKDGKNPLVFSEAIVYDAIEDEAGTIDLLIVEEDGTANIYDWKFMSTARGAQDISWFKKGAYGVQLGQYKKILQDNYGVRRIGKNRAIPIQLKLKRENFQDPTSNLLLNGIGIGSVNPQQVEDLTLTPVVEKTESTGIERLDKLIAKLNAVYTQISETVAVDETERSSKRERLNILQTAIRQAQVNQNIAPIITAVGVMQAEGQNIISDYENLYKDKPLTENSFEDEELSDFSSRIDMYLVSITAFEKIAVDLEPIIQGSDLSDKDKAFFQNEINSKQNDIQRAQEEITELAGRFGDKYMGLLNSVTGLTKPQAVVNFFVQTFRSAAQLPLPSIRILTRLARKAMTKGQADALKDVNRLDEIKNKIKNSRQGSISDIVKDIQKKIYQKDDKGGLVNKLIYRFSRDFYTALKENAENARSKKWIKENIDIAGYTREANEIIRRETLKYNNIYSNDQVTRDRSMREMRRKWDLNDPQFNGFGNYVLRRHPLPKWESKEYLELKKDPQLFELYNFLIEMNEKARDMGYLQNRIAGTFIPFIRKGFAESLAWDGGSTLSAIQNFGAKLTRRMDDVGYGGMNQITGEVENSIPKYYTVDFTRTEDGSYDNSDLSLDFFKNQILFINHMNKYKYMSAIEGQVKLMQTIVRAKSHLRTGFFGRPVKEGGEFIVDENNNRINSRFFDLFVQNTLYDNPYPADGTDFGVPTASIKKGWNSIMKSIGYDAIKGKPFFSDTEEGTNISIVKSMEVLNTAFQMKTLGLEPISAAVNSFGTNLQMAAQSGVYYNYRDFLKNEVRLLGNKYKSDQERDMFVQLQNIFMPLKDSPTYQKLLESSASAAQEFLDKFSDRLFIGFRSPELHLERSLFKTLLQNSMVVDGKIVNINTFVRNKYKDRYNNARTFQARKAQIDQEIEQLKKTKSMDVTKRLDKNGKVEIPGLDLTNRDELQRLTNLTRDIARSSTGGFTEFDNIKANMNIWFKSMMVFKGWIPKLVDTRFGEFRKVGDDFEVRIDENGLTTGEKYDIGRVRLFLGNFTKFILIPNLVKYYNIQTANEKGIEEMDKMFLYYSRDYEARTGERLNMSREDFFDLVRTNSRKTMQELVLIVMLNLISIQLGFFEPEDEQDKAARNRFRFYKKVVNRFSQELMFFYNPAEWQGILSQGIIPSVSLLSEFKTFSEHFAEEVTGTDFSNLDKSPGEVRDDAYPVKYAMRMFPLTKSLVTWLAIFDPEWAEEMDVTIQETNR